MLANKVQAAAQVVSGGGGTTYVAVSFDVSPFIKVYPWSSATGFGTAFANPASLPNNGQDVVFRPQGDAIFTTLNSGMTGWQWSAAGFGTRYTDVATLTNYSIACHPSGNAVAYTSPDFPRVVACPFSTATGFGTQYANPSPVVASAGSDARFHPSGNAIAITDNGFGSVSPWFQIYAWSNASGFGTKYAAPATGLSHKSDSCAFAPSGDAIAFQSQGSPWVHAYPFSTSTGIGTKFSNPAVIPSSASRVNFNPASNVLIAGGDRVHAWAWSAGGFGTKFADPAVPAVDSYYRLGFAPDGSAIVAGAQNSPRVHAWAWSAGGFGAKYSNPGVLPTGAVKGVSFVTV